MDEDLLPPVGKEWKSNGQEIEKLKWKLVFINMCIFIVFFGTGCLTSGS